MNKNLSSARAAAMLKLYEEIRSPAKVGKRFGVTEQGVCYWLPYLGLNAKWLPHVKRMEEQLRRLKLKLAHHQKHMKIATSLIKRMQPSPKRRSLIATAVIAKYPVPRSVANRIVGISSCAGSDYHANQLDLMLVEAMRTHLSHHPGRGFAGMYNAFLRHQPGTRERALRLYTEHLMKWNRSKKKKVHSLARVQMEQQGKLNSMWSMDFMQDVLSAGTKYWVLTIVDDFNREAIAVLAIKRRTAKAVVEHLAHLLSQGRRPEKIRTDNGTEFTSACYQSWEKSSSVAHLFTRRGKPTDNSFIERFNRTVRSEVLSRFRFNDITEVQGALDDWRLNYNFVRPHNALGGLSPMQYAHAHRWYVADKSGWR